MQTMTKPGEIRDLLTELEGQSASMIGMVQRLRRMLYGAAPETLPAAMPWGPAHEPPKDRAPISKMTSADRGKDTTRCQVCKEPAPVVIALGSLWACSRCVMLGEAEAVRMAELVKARGKA